MTQTGARELETSEKFKISESNSVGSYLPKGKQSMNSAITEKAPTPVFFGEPETERSFGGKGKRFPWYQRNYFSDISTNHRNIPSRNYRRHSDVTRPKFSSISASGNSAVEFGKSTPLLGRKSREQSQDCATTVSSVDNNPGRTDGFDSEHSEASYDQRWPQFPGEWIESRSVEMMTPVTHSQQASTTNEKLNAENMEFRTMSSTGEIHSQNPATYTQSLDEVRHNYYSNGNIPMYMPEYPSVEPCYNPQNEGNTGVQYYDAASELHPQGLVPFVQDMPPECCSNPYETNVYPQELANIPEDSFSSMCESFQYNMPSSMQFPSMMYPATPVVESEGTFNGAGPSIPFTPQSWYADGSPCWFQEMYTCATNPADIFYPSYLTSGAIAESLGPKEDEIGNTSCGNQKASGDNECPDMFNQTPMTEEPFSSFVPFQEVDKIPVIEQQSAVVHLQTAEEQALVDSINEQCFCMETVSDSVYDQDKVLTGFTDVIFETVTVSDRSDTSESRTDLEKQCLKSREIKDDALIVQSRCVRKENTPDGKLNEDTPTVSNVNSKAAPDANATNPSSGVLNCCTGAEHQTTITYQDNIVDTKFAQLSFDHDDRIETNAKDVFCRSERNTEDDVSDNFITMITFYKGNTTLSRKSSFESSCGEKYFTASEKCSDTSMTIATEHSSDSSHKFTLCENSSSGSLPARSSRDAFGLRKRESSDLSFKSISDRDGKDSNDECEFGMVL